MTRKVKKKAADLAARAAAVARARHRRAVRKALAWGTVGAAVAIIACHLAKLYDAGDAFHLSVAVVAERLAGMAVED